MFFVVINSTGGKLSLDLTGLDLFIPNGPTNSEGLGWSVQAQVSLGEIDTLSIGRMSLCCEELSLVHPTGSGRVRFLFLLLFLFLFLCAQFQALGPTRLNVRG